MKVIGVEEKLKNRIWKAKGVSATFGWGVREALGFLADEIKNQPKQPKVQ